VIETLTELCSTHRTVLYPFLRTLHRLGDPIITGTTVSHEYERYAAAGEGAALTATEFDVLIRHTHEVLATEQRLYLAVRLRVAQWEFLEFHSDEMRCRSITVSEYLDAKERLVDGHEDPQRYVLEVDLAPFERGFPRLTEARSIGRGVEFLNRVLSGRLFQQHLEGRERLLRFLRAHQIQGQQLMLNGQIDTVPELRQQLRRAVDELRGHDPSDEDWLRTLRSSGFEPGWGRTAELAREMMELLLDLLEAADPRQLQDFLARIPMITSIAILSPHGYFGQADVLGKPDTGGQVVYILDQVRALEHAMRQSLRDQGLTIDPQVVVVSRLIPDADGTTCDVRLEPIVGTEHARILRVPFRTERGDVVRPWVSRFKIWPYLERFAVDAERELLAELGRRPDFILGNYSDGNLVASLMARRLGVTQCNIAHALEKTKYLHSDAHWRTVDDEYHFACQFTADLIAMNTADFIITSTYQEIAGTPESVGQYESYQAYTLPGLYRVVSGIDCFDPKFNIVSPGANPDVFFPFWQHDRRIGAVTEEMRRLVYGEPNASSRGKLARPEKPLLFTISRLDQIKNTAGLLEWFGQSPELREQANLVLVGGFLDPNDSNDDDERRQAQRLHDLMDRHHLDDEVRWLAIQASKSWVGELYRVVGDSGGAFVQPAFYEAFGLTVVEAMASGLPVFVTRYGGPSEIVEDGRSGFHIDPLSGREAAHRMAQFLSDTKADPQQWREVAERAVQRVNERYNWPLYASRLLELSRIYGFWKYSTSLERDETRRYLDMLYGLMYRPLAEKVS
jgi:sucrose synthase